MKRIAIVFILLVFIVFAYLGFQAASNLKTNPSAAGLPVNAATALASTQQNYILIHVDDLTQAKPKLISAWGVFVYYASVNQVMFIPMLPSYDAAVQTSLASEFSLDKTGQVNSRFISQLQQKFNVKITGVVVTDNTGLSLFNNWVAGQSNPILAAPPQGDDEKHVVLLNAQGFFQTVCTAVQNKSTDLFSTIDWGQLVPGHFVTNMSFETIMADYQKLMKSSAPNQCTVLSNE